MRNGLAEDVRHTGQWNARRGPEARIGQPLPEIEITAETAKGRQDLETLRRPKLTVIAWIWARTVKSPNPAFARVSAWLASQRSCSPQSPAKEAYVEPVIAARVTTSTVRIG